MQGKIISSKNCNLSCNEKKTQGKDDVQFTFVSSTDLASFCLNWRFYNANCHLYFCMICFD